MKIQWNRSKDGFVQSKDGRFRIQPEYMGCTEAQGYAITDTKTGKKWSADTQGILKAEAQETVDKENL